MKTPIILASSGIILFSIAIYFYIKQSTQDDVAVVELTQEASSTHGYGRKNSGIPLATTNIAVEPTHIDAAETLETSANENAINYIDYSEQWCQQAQLSPRDKLYAQSEIASWEEKVGRYTYSSVTEYGFIAGEAVSAPYLEISKQSLLQYIEDGNAMAMFAAFDRGDLGMEKQKLIAERLLAEGYTGKAIQELVIYELSKAEADFETNSQTLTSKAKAHVANALVYATYSLKLYDAIGFMQIGTTMEYVPAFQEKLNPASMFSETDITNILKNADLLSESINFVRQDKGLPPNEREFTKIAKHILDRDIGTLHGSIPTTMQLLSNQFGDSLSQLGNNECRQRHSEMFALN